MNHAKHIEEDDWHSACPECQLQQEQWIIEDKAVDWLMAVRKYGLEKANEMFPED